MYICMYACNVYMYYTDIHMYLYVCVCIGIYYADVYMQICMYIHIET